MNYPARILFQSFVKPFYKENAGLFVFVFTMMFCIVSKVDGAGLYEYHYSLAAGMLTSNVFLLLVFFTWFLYARKCVVFVSDLMLQPRYSFLQIYNELSKAKRRWLFFIVEIWLLMPVLLYALFICFVGCKQQLYLPVLLVICYLLLLCVMAAAWHVYLLANPGRKNIVSLKHLTARFLLPQFFPLTLIRFVANEKKIIWAGVKVFTCGILYLIARNNTYDDYDISMPFLFFNFGILANGVLIYRIREFEEIYLSFYKGLPVSLLKRFLQYLLIFFILLIPEFVTVATLVPVHLHYADAVNITLCGFGLLLLMNSITFLANFKMKEYIIILLAVFCVQCILLMTVGFVFLYLLFFASAITIFLKSCHQFEYQMQD